MAWPTTNNPRTVFVTIRLTEDEAQDLDAYAQATHSRSRSAAVRDAVNRVIDAHKRKQRTGSRKTASKKQAS